MDKDIVPGRIKKIKGGVQPTGQFLLKVLLAAAASAACMLPTGSPFFLKNKKNKANVRI